MPNYTITYSDSLKGWTSFHSYDPQWMAGLNNDFYTFKGGKVWKHHSNETRNNYYGVQGDSVVRTILNTEPDVVKMFKTIKLKGTGDTAWAAQVISDLNNGSIPLAGYEKKEGNWYGYVRRNANDLDLKYLSTQGMGLVSATATVGDVVQISIIGDVTAGISVKTQFSAGPPVVEPQDNGDLLFSATVSGLNITAVGGKLGQVQTISYNAGTNITTIEMVKHPLAAGAPTAPVVGSYLIAAKNSTAESYGLRGVYMDVTLTNSETDHTELFSISSEVFKSYQ
jgi:hypothetical protein